MEIKTKQVIELIEYENNPRVNEKAVKMVAESIKKFGFKQPIVIDSNNVIVAGHTRLRASKVLGLDEVPVIMADDLTKEQIKEYRIADNRTRDLSEWDYDLLDDELWDLENSGIDTDWMDFDFKDELDLADEAGEVPENVETICQEGDLWKLGEHRLLCGDSTDAGHVELLMDGHKADMVFTDPPYNVNYTYNKYEDNKSTKDYLKFVDDVFNNISNNVKGGAPIYVMSGSKYLIELGNLFKKYFRFSQILVWVKDNPTLGNSDYQYNHEPMIYGWKRALDNPEIQYNREMIRDEIQKIIHRTDCSEECRRMLDDFSDIITMNDYQDNFDAVFYGWHKDNTHKFYGGCMEPTASTIDRDRGIDKTDHGAQRPIDLVSIYVKNSSREGELVLDLFGGSGSTLIVADSYGRKCNMMEFDPYYCDVIIERWEHWTDNKAEKIN